MGIPTRQSRLVSNFEALALQRAQGFSSRTGPSLKDLFFSSNQGPSPLPRSMRSEARPTDGDQAASSPPGILRNTLTHRAYYSASYTHSHHSPSHEYLAPALVREETSGDTRLT